MIASPLPVVPVDDKTKAAGVLGCDPTVSVSIHKVPISSPSRPVGLVSDMKKPSAVPDSP